MAGRPKSIFIIGVLAIAIAAVASISLYNYLKGQEAKVKSTIATEKVVVAAVEIPVGTAINITQIKTVDWPKANVPQGAFTISDQVVGRVAIDRYTSGEPIIEAKLVPKEGQGGVMSYKIPEGHRAMTVGVDQVAGVAGFITPGNKVDVVLTVTPQGTKQQQQISKIVLQDVPVLAIGQTVEQQKEGKAVVVPTVTVDVTPEDAEKLAIASTQGKLQLVLRRAGDTELTKTSGATVTKVLSGVAKAEPVPTPKVKVVKKAAEKKQAVAKEEIVEKPAPVMRPDESAKVEVWRSNQRTVETFRGAQQ